MENTNNNLQSSSSFKISELIVKFPIILQLTRFAAIGVLNTALDFLVLNFLSKTLGITKGFELGGVNAPGFILAVIQSYVWNKYWTFSAVEAQVSVWKNFLRLVAVGALGFFAFVGAIFGATKQANPSFYLIIFLLFIVIEVVFLEIFGILKNPTSAQSKLVNFLAVSLVGLAINIFFVSVLSGFSFTSNPDLNLNIAKIIATFVSLAWNFIGYKILVFKK